MTKLFGAVVGFLSFFQTRPTDKAKIDNSVFRLHYDFTVGFFFLATGLLSLNDLFGKAILCRGLEGSKVTEAPDAVTQYCWVSGTYTVPDFKRGIGHHKTSEKSDLSGELCKIDCGYEDTRSKFYSYTKTNELKQLCDECKGYAGQCDSMLKDNNDELVARGKVSKCRDYHNYYQWVPYLFILQGIMFLLPHRLWEYLEEGKMEAIAKAAKNANLKEKERANVINRIAHFIKAQERGFGHRRYAFSYLLCTGLNLLNVVVNIFLLDRFLGTSNFLSLGPRWLNSLKDSDSGETSAGFLKTIFPREVMCQWHQYGSGGHAEWHVYLCLLASNVITEKVIVFLWFWLFFLLILSTGVFVYLSLLLFSQSVTIRNYFLSFAVGARPKNFWKDKAKRVAEEHRLVKYLRKVPSWNFLFLYMLAGNVDRSTLGEILEAVQSKETKKTKNQETEQNPQIEAVRASAPPSERTGGQAADRMP